MTPDQRARRRLDIATQIARRERELLLERRRWYERQKRIRIRQRVVTSLLFVTMLLIVGTLAWMAGVAATERSDTTDIEQRNALK
jgi:hypothetical protein